MNPAPPSPPGSGMACSEHAATRLSAPPFPIQCRRPCSVPPPPPKPHSFQCPTMQCPPCPVPPPFSATNAVPASTAHLQQQRDQRSPGPCRPQVQATGRPPKVSARFQCGRPLPRPPPKPVPPLSVRPPQSQCPPFGPPQSQCLPAAALLQGLLQGLHRP